MRIDSAFIFSDDQVRVVVFGLVAGETDLRLNMKMFFERLPDLWHVAFIQPGSDEFVGNFDDRKVGVQPPQPGTGEPNFHIGL